MNMASDQPNVCGRQGCGSRLLCCRPDCPLVTVDLEPGLKRIMTRTAFVSEITDCAVGMGIDVAAIEQRARERVNAILG
jgi:hypothetical protein